MSKTNNVPKIRFPEFHDEWEQCKLGELVEIGDIDHRMPPSVEDGIPYLMTGDFRGINELNFKGVKRISIEDYEKLSRKIKPEKGDIIFARYASVGAVRYIDFTNDFLISYSCAIIKKSKKIDSKYLYHYLTGDCAQKQIKLEINSSSQANIGIDSMKNFIRVLMPSEDEQTKISEFLSNFDTFITLHQRKCDAIKELKKSMLQNMFPRDGERVPRLRFPGFTDDWEQRKLGDEFERVNERNNGQFGITHWISVAKMYYQEPDKVQSNNLDTRTYVMRKGDIAFEGHPNSEFQFGRFVANDIGDGIISELFPIYRHKMPYINSYWKYAIQIERVMRPIYAKAITSSGASSNKLNEEHFLREDILVPSIKEQEAIGTLLTNVDNLITIHQRKCDELKKIKKYILNNMFPKV